MAIKAVILGLFTFLEDSKIDNKAPVEKPIGIIFSQQLSKMLKPLIIDSYQSCQVTYLIFSGAVA